MKVKLAFSNGATESDLKIATGVHTSYFAKRVDLAGLKADPEKLDFDKLKTRLKNENLEVYQMKKLQQIIISSQS